MTNIRINEKMKDAHQTMRQDGKDHTAEQIILAGFLSSQQ